MPITRAALQRHMIASSGSNLLRLHIHGQRFDVALSDHGTARPLGATVLLDELTPDRLDAVARFSAALRGQAPPPDPRITPQRHQRTRRMLRVFDAQTCGSTYRDIAIGLFPDHATTPAEWVGTPIRETTIRLARDGRALVCGGYRALRRRPRRQR